MNESEYLLPPTIGTPRARVPADLLVGVHVLLHQLVPMPQVAAQAARDLAEAIGLQAAPSQTGARRITPRPELELGRAGLDGGRVDLGREADIGIERSHEVDGRPCSWPSSSATLAAGVAQQPVAFRNSESSLTSISLRPGVTTVTYWLAVSMNAQARDGAPQAGKLGWLGPSPAGAHVTERRAGLDAEVLLAQGSVELHRRPGRPSRCPRTPRPRCG